MREFYRHDMIKGRRKDLKKEWRKAVVIYRQDFDIQWSIINKGLSRKLRRRVEVALLHPDRAVLWCLSEGEKRKMLRYAYCSLHNTRLVKVVDWNQREYWDQLRIAGRNKWVGVDGLPLNWWNKHVLKVLGSKLGGLLENQSRWVYVMSMTISSHCQQGDTKATAAGLVGKDGRSKKNPRNSPVMAWHI
ncbi:hypothetical protein TorRG33x02_275110 [Trema orientale]|uniref:Uncharacterized protein n=1 Tax=Trema orientale TaxID=63057 RepID=A0A2P5CRZ0_TREOI|nr:hypothetical protein TorRG33x02_275110 [Trema orientale]